MNSLVETEKAGRLGLLLMCLGGVLMLIVIVVAGALALRPPRSGYTAGPGLNVLLFGLFAATIGIVALISGSWQRRTGCVNELAMQLILGLGFALIVAIEWLTH